MAPGQAMSAAGVALKRLPVMASQGAKAKILGRRMEGFHHLVLGPTKTSHFMDIQNTSICVYNICIYIYKKINIIISITYLLGSVGISI